MNDYQERKEARIERLQDRAAKAKDQAEALWKSTKSEYDVIDGQPILIGHHSERRHRNHLDRLHARDRKAMELYKKSEELERRAEAAESNTAISSDDPDAVELLQIKLLELENQRTVIKNYNAMARKKGEEQIPRWKLTNLGANIRSIKQRIKKLQSIARLHYEEVEINGVKIVLNPEENRVQLFFDGKPDYEIRKELKSNGFRWSPSNGCWQRNISNWAVHVAKDIAGKMATEDVEQ